MGKQKKKARLFLLYIVAVLTFGILLMPFVSLFTQEDGVYALKQMVTQCGAWGVLFLLLVQIIQIVVAFIPGEVVELVSGVMYGAWWGLLLDLVGIAIGQTIVYYTVARLGSDAVEWVSSNPKMQKLTFLKKERNVEWLLFVLFFIPGTPKDMLCYMAPLLKIRFKTFLIISVLARIPSVLSSTYAGENLGAGNFEKTVLIYVAIAIVSIIGLCLNQKIMNRRSKQNGADD